MANSNDELESEPVFSRGEQVAFHLGGRGKLATTRVFGDAYYNVRGRNKVYDPQGILLEQLKIYGNELVVGAGAQWQLVSGWRLGPRADWHHVAGNEYGFGTSSVVGVGGQVGHQLTARIGLRGAAEYFTGSTDGGAIDLAGTQLTLVGSGTF